jgi:hypothetical protein
MKRRFFFRVLIHVFLPLLIGLLIYLVYRPNVWLVAPLNFSSNSLSGVSNYSAIKKWIIFSGPDLCWAYSFASAIFILNHLMKFSSHGFIFIVFLIIVAASELIQLFLEPNFTFSFPDLVTVVVATCLSAYLNKRI